jgi:ketosteroid isomerase-like protein
MKFALFFLSIFLFAAGSYAQPSIDGMVKAERSFAAYALAHGIKQAFLQFTDSTAVMFDKGQPVNAVQLWHSRGEQAGILNWGPDFVEIAGSQDFGYTTGPWTYYRNSTDDSIAGRGRFITVWHIDGKGDWKFLIDLGVANVPAAADTILRKIQITDPSLNPGKATDLLETENDFIRQSNKSMMAAYLAHLSEQSILNRNGIHPVRSRDAILQMLNGTTDSIQYKINGWGIAPSGDLGYVYGTTFIGAKTDNYLHIWRREKEGWKLALEVLRF